MVGLLGAVVLLARPGAAGPSAPVTPVTALPPADASLTGATGRLPDSGVAPVPGVPDAALPGPAPLPGAVDGSALGIPETVLAAYRAAATTMDRDAPGCRLTWPLVAGIGKVESGHASGGAVDAEGTTRRPILGPQLTGTGGNAAIRDTDGGALDHDATWDRAVGPTQFIPSSWRVYGADGSGDGRADPDNVFDAGLATARHLCSGGGDLAGAAARHDAVFRYNHSEDYVATVLRWADSYASGALPVPDSPGLGGPAADDAPVTLAALPSSPVPTTGGVPAAVPAPAPSVGTPGAPPPGPAPAPAPSPAPLRASTTPTTGSTGSTGTAAGAPHGALAPSSTTASSTTASSTTASSTTASSTAPPGAGAPKPAALASSSTGSSTPRPPSHPASATTPPPSSTSSSSTTRPPSSTTTSPSTTTSTTPCAALVPAVGKAAGIAAGDLTAASTAGPGAGRTTCTVRGPQGPVLVAVTGPAPPTPTTGVSRTLAGGRTVLTVPTTSGLPQDRAKAVLTSVVDARPAS